MSAGHTSVRAVRDAAVNMTARSTPGSSVRSMSVGFRLLLHRLCVLEQDVQPDDVSQEAQREADRVRATPRSRASDRETKRTDTARRPARPRTDRRRIPPPVRRRRAPAPGKRSTGRIRPHATGGSRRSGSSASPSGLATLRARNAGRPTTGIPISRSQLRLVCSMRTRRSLGIEVTRGGTLRPTNVCRPSQKCTVRSTRTISGSRASNECRLTASRAEGGGPTAASSSAAAATRSVRRDRVPPISGCPSASRS